jgi:hypothetical protein
MHYKTLIRDCDEHTSLLRIKFGNKKFNRKGPRCKYFPVSLTTVHNKLEGLPLAFFLASLIYAGKLRFCLGRLLPCSQMSD